jgi:hypothetical protein
MQHAADRWCQGGELIWDGEEDNMTAATEPGAVPSRHTDLPNPCGRIF